MWKASLHTLKGRLWQLLLCLVSIAIAVAAISTAVSLNALVRTTTDGVVAATAADITVLPAGTLASTDAVVKPPPLGDSTIAAIAELPGVASARGQIRANVALYPITSSGEVLRPQLAPTIAGSYLSATPHAGLPAVAVSDGRAPEGEDEVVLDEPTLRRSGYELGDTLHFARPGAGAPIPATVVGIVRLAGDRPAGASYALFSESAARRHFLDAQPGFNSIWIDIEDDADPAELMDAIRDYLPTEYQSVDGSRVASATTFQLHPRLTLAQIGLWVAGALVLGVAAALISTTTAHLVARRRGEAAFLRRQGASTFKVSLPIIAEAALLGLAGSAVGLPLGQWLAGQLNEVGRTHGLSLGAVIPALGTTEAWLCVGVGVLIAVLAAHRHATAVSFRSAMLPREAIPHPRMRFSDSAWTSVGLVAVGVGLLVVGTTVPGMPLPWAWAVLGAVVVLIGTATAAPVLGAPLVRLIGLAGRPLLRDVSTIAARNVTRHPARFAKAAAALVLGVGIVATFAVLGASGRASANNDLPENLQGDLFITSSINAGFSREFAAAALGIAEVEAVRSYTLETALQGGEPRRVMVADPGALEAIVDLEVTEGRAPTAVDEVMVESQHAVSKGLKRGRSLNLVINQERVEVRIVGVFEAGRGVDVAEFTSLRETFAARGVPQLDTFVSIDLASASAASDVQAALGELVATNPLLRVQTMQQLADARGELLATVADTLDSLLSMLAWIAIIGITGTLLIAIHERRPEFRSLRLVGMDRYQVTGMVALEALTMGSVGGLLGTAAGAVSGWGLQRGLQERGYPLLEMPWDTLWGLAWMGVLVGLASAVLPTLFTLRLLGPFQRPARTPSPAAVGETTANAV